MDIDASNFAMLVIGFLAILSAGGLITTLYGKSRDEADDVYWQDIKEQVDEHDQRLEHIETNYIRSGPQDLNELAKRTKSKNQ